jgi:anti-anti-sigma factor
MEITKNTQAHPIELKLKGRMDAIWSDYVGRTLAECIQGGHHAIALDMEEVSYLSSVGIRVLVLYARQLRKIQGAFSIINASGEVRRVLLLAGLDALLQAPSAPPAAQPNLSDEASEPIELPLAGAQAEVFNLGNDAVIRGQWLGSPEDWLAGRGSVNACPSVSVDAKSMGLGLGAFGNEVSREQLGEFVAASGTAVCLPADGSNQPDYMLEQGALVPTLKVAYGIIGQGSFSRLLRFDQGKSTGGIPLSTLAQAALKAVRSDAAALVLVAEVASMIGAALQKLPPVADTSAPGPSLFAYPSVRDWLNFTAETAFGNSVGMIVGFVASAERARQLRWFKPLDPSRQLNGHLHAAAFPYRPIRKGRIVLADTLAPMFDNEHILGLLHLINDWRPASGSGESQFQRGACWIAPLVEDK